MESLYDAALQGDVSSLKKLLNDDPLLLEQCSIVDKAGLFSRSPLHIAVTFGHIAFVKELMKIKPNMCFARDQDGCNPVHVAAMGGQVDVLEILLKAKPQAAGEQLHGGETALHLCVKYSQYDALQKFADVLKDFHLHNVKDKNGNNILHLAVKTKQYKMVTFLLKDDLKLDKNAINTEGLTAMDICIQSFNDDTNEAIRVFLRKAKALDAEDVLRPKNRVRKWVDDQQNALMVVASLLATMAFQVAVTPPGGTWPDTKDGHKVGMSVLATEAPKTYNKLLYSSTIALVTSLSVILLLVSGLPVGPPLVATLTVTMWLSISATAYNFKLATQFVSGKGDSRDRETQPLSVIIPFGIWATLMLFLIIKHSLHLIRKLVRKFKDGRSIRSVFQGFVTSWSEKAVPLTLTQMRSMDSSSLSA